MHVLGSALLSHEDVCGPAPVPNEYARIPHGGDIVEVYLSTKYARLRTIHWRLVLKVRKLVGHLLKDV